QQPLNLAEDADTHAAIQGETRRADRTSSIAKSAKHGKRREDTKRRVLTLVARSLDNIVASCTGKLKGTAKQITTLFSSFLSERVHPDQTDQPTKTRASGGGPSAAQKPDWATAAKSGSHRPPPNNIHRGQPPPTKTLEDIRILVRLPEKELSGAKTLTNFGLREAACKELGLSLIDIPDTHHTATGFAIRPRNIMIRHKILAKEKELGRCLRATKIELPTKWYNYVVPGCPAKLPNILSEQVDFASVIHDEVIAQTGLQPTSRELLLSASSA
ncbi:hypothetical protein CSAL01_13023, partial [Colletotrichum salicis]